MLPLSTVDKPGFRAMIHQFNPRYQLPTHKHFTKVAIPVLVNAVKSKIEEQIKSKQLEYFSATTDLWTSAAGDPYITLLFILSMVVGSLVILPVDPLPP